MPAKLCKEIGAVQVVFGSEVCNKSFQTIHTQNVWTRSMMLPNYNTYITYTTHKPNMFSKALTFVGHVHEVLDILRIGWQVVCKCLKACNATRNVPWPNACHSWHVNPLHLGHAVQPWMNVCNDLIQTDMQLLADTYQPKFMPNRSGEISRKM